MNEIIKVPPQYPPTVALSELSLELSEPVEGWPTFLGACGVKIIGDDLGRDSVSRSDARRLLDEQREEEVRRAALRRLAEQQAVEADELRRQQIWKGVPADAMPADALPVSVMLQAAHDSQPKRRSVLEDAFEHSGTVMHTFNGEAKDWWVMRPAFEITMRDGSTVQVPEGISDVAAYVEWCAEGEARSSARAVTPPLDELKAWMRFRHGRELG